MTTNRATVGSAQLAHGDALDLLAELKPESIDGFVTDPPYSSGGMYRGDRTQAVAAKYVRVDRSLAEFAGDMRDQRGYRYWSVLWMRLALAAARPGGVLLVFTDWRQLPTTTDALQAAGWVWRGIVPWNKTESARPAKGRFKAQCEYVVWGSRGSLGSEVGGYRPALPGLFTHRTPGNKRHVAEKPLGLLRDLLEILPAGGLVCDPFAGYGTTAVAAIQTGRRFIGAELDRGWFERAVTRIRETDVPPLFQSLLPPDEGKP